MTEERKNEIRKDLLNFPARSAWLRGVKDYAVEWIVKQYEKAVSK